MNWIRKALSATTLVAVSLGVAPVLSAVTATPAAAASIPAVGVQFHATWADYNDAQRIAVLDALAAAKVGWVRIDLGWRAFEETGKGQIAQWQVDLVDKVVNQARARGIKVLGTVLDTPAWANGGGGTNVPPSNVNDYADFMRWMAAHFKGRVSAWELWNEPNLSDFWSTKDPTSYASLVKAAYPAIKSQDPGALVVAGVVSGNDDPWLARMYNAGAGGSFDVLSVHPYQGPADGPPETADGGNTWQMDHVRAVHNLMVARGDGAKQLWATEYGWSSHANTGSEPSWKKGVTEQQQADYLVRSITWFGNAHPYVSNVFWYNEREKATGDPQEDGYGILRRNLTPKPAYTALAALLNGSPIPVVTPGPAPLPASGVGPAAPAPVPVPVWTANPSIAYRLIARDGRRIDFTDGGGSAMTGPLPLAPGRSVVAAAATKDGNGAWAVSDDGAVYASGNAPFLGAMAGTPLNRPIVGAAATPSGNGYWLVASDGGIFSYGDAAFYGSTGGMHLNQPIVGMASTPSGHGYWLVARDGGIFSYGDAAFYGSTGSIRLNQPIVGLAPTADGSGYWMVAADGGIFAFGNSPFFGSTGSIKLNRPIVGMTPTQSGRGYWMVASDGGIFSYGDARFLGSGASTGANFAGMVAR
jgi:hypothetical protein